MLFYAAKYYSAILIALGLLAASGCATAPDARLENNGAISQVIVEEIEKTDEKIEEESQEFVESQVPPSRGKIHDRGKIPIEVNQSVKTWIDYFTGNGRERFQRYLERGARYRSLVLDTLRKHKIPEELYYLAMIESGYAAHARSRQRAVGIW